MCSPAAPPTVRLEDAPESVAVAWVMLLVPAPAVMDSKVVVPGACTCDAAHLESAKASGRRILVEFELVCEESISSCSSSAASTFTVRE